MTDKITMELADDVVIAKTADEALAHLAAGRQAFFRISSLTTQQSLLSFLDQMQAITGKGETKGVLYLDAGMSGAHAPLLVTDAKTARAAEAAARRRMQPAARNHLVKKQAAPKTIVTLLEPEDIYDLDPNLPGARKRGAPPPGAKP